VQRTLIAEGVSITIINSAINKIITSAKAGDKEAIKQFIFASAQDARLLPLLLHEHGEDKFYKDCARNTQWYDQFLYVRSNISKDKALYKRGMIHLRKIR
jgi:hypothetical protein